MCNGGRRATDVWQYSGTMRELLRFGVTAAAYFVAARMGYALAIPGGVVTLWPPSGLMLALLCLSGRGRWPAIIVGGLAGSIASDLFSDYSPGLALAAAGANAIETVAAAMVLRWWCGSRVALSDLRSVLGFVIGAVVISNGLTAMLGALTLDRPFLIAWLVWWIGDGVGMLIVAPVVLGLAHQQPQLRRVTALQVGEAAAIGATLVITVWVALGRHHGLLLESAPYVVFPLLSWAGLRFGPAGAAIGVAVAALAAIGNASVGQGPFVDGGATGEILALHVHVYLFVASLASLIPAAVFAERQAAKRDVAESERRYRNLFESNPTPTWVYDRGTLRILAVNDAAIRRYGYSREEFLAATILDIRPPEDVPKLVRWLRQPDSALPTRSVWKHRLKDGTIIDVDVSSHAILLAGREARVVQSMDLTDQRRAEESLRATRERLDHVIASSGAVLFQMEDGRSRRVNWVSSNVTTVFGYTLDDVLRPEWWLATAHHEDQARVLDLDENDTTGLAEYRLRDTGGRYRWIREERRRLHHGDEQPTSWVGTWIDVTHWRDLEEQFRQSQKLEAVGRLSGSIAHDFNNLLTVVLGETELLLLMPLASNDSARASLEAVHAAAERAALLTRQLLMFSRRQIAVPTRLDMSRIVMDLDRMIRRLIGEDVEVVLRLDADLPRIFADRGQVEQVLVNLIVNARDAMPAGGVLTIATTVIESASASGASPGSAASGRYVALAVSDTGIGMSAEVKQRLFEPFFTTKEPGKGTGLGLATCDAIAHQHGGWLTVESQPGAGATFHMYLPVAPDGAADPAEAAHGPVCGGHETILVVEDDRDVRHAAVRTLRNQGYEVHEARDGDDATRFLESTGVAIDLLLTDVVLPKRGGRAVADFAKRARPDIRVLFMSGYSDDDILDSRLRGHEAELLQKPFTTDELARRVRQVLDTRVGE